MEYSELEQRALSAYWEAIKKENPGYIIPIDGEGKLTHPNYSGRLKFIAEKEVNDMGYVLGVDQKGELTEDAITRIDDVISIIVEDLYKSKEERLEARKYRALNSDEGGYELYEYLVNQIANDYKLYTSICESHGIEPHAIYDGASKKQTL